MIDLNSLTLYQKKISSYIDENVLNISTKSNINYLFAHKYKIVVFNKPDTGSSSYNMSAMSNLRLFRNGQQLTVKSINKNNMYDTTAILTDGEYDCELRLVAPSINTNNVAVYNALNSGWVSKHNSPCSITLEFDMDNLTKISYQSGKSDGFGYTHPEDNAITIFCDDNQIYNKNTIIPYRDKNQKIHINFDNYNDVNVTYTRQ